MPINHHINHASKLILTSVVGDASDIEFIHAIEKYQKDIKNTPDYLNFNEIVDLSDVTNMQITTTGIMTISRIAAETDREGEQTKLALIVSSSLAYGMARMYSMYRSFSPKANKDVRVFNNKQDAYQWLNTNPHPDQTSE